MKPEDTIQTQSGQPPEHDSVMKIEFGLVLPVRATNVEDLIQKSQVMANALIEHINNFYVKPEILHVLNAEAMERGAFEQLKANAREQAARLGQMLQAFVGTLGPGGDAASEQQNQAPSAGDTQVVGGAVVDEIEPSPDAFRAPGSRSLN